MNSQSLDLLVGSDKNIILKQLKYFENIKDKFHVERKQQQRAISLNMVLIALNYGDKKRSFQDVIYSLNDRCLLNTPYEKYLSKLRGLTIVGNWEYNEYKDLTFIIITCFWNYTIKSRKRF
jgi:hypothetical protein